MANAKGLQCSKSNFWKLLHNPVYCGFVPCSLGEFEEKQLVKGIHEPIIAATLYKEVQNIINTKRRVASKTHKANDMFILNKYLICPICNRKLCGSFSKGRSKRYPYYHCKPNCKIRFKANILNENYESKLKKVKLSSGVNSLFDLIVRDINVNTQLSEYLNERKFLSEQVKEQEFFIAKVRKLLVAGKIEFDDFSKLKKEYLDISNGLNDELSKVTIKLGCVDKQLNSVYSFDKILSRFKDLNVNDKMHMINFISPSGVDTSGNFSLQLNHALSKILSCKKKIQTVRMIEKNLLVPSQQGGDRNVTIKKAVHILAQNNIDVDDEEASIILDFLYLVAKFSKKPDDRMPLDTLSGNRILKSGLKPFAI